MRIKGKERGLIVVAILAFAIAGCGSSGGSSGVSISSGDSNTPIIVDSTADMNVGDLMLVQMEDRYLVIDFEGVDSDAEFMLVTGTSQSDGSVSFLISDDLLADIEKNFAILSEEGLEAIDESYGPEEILSAWLRASEAQISETEPMPSFSVNKGIESPDLTYEGQTKSFRVLKNINSTSQYETVYATAQCVTSNVAIFIDRRLDDSDLSSSEIDEICSEFDYVASWEDETLGSPSDINSDGIVAALITPQVNMLGSSAGGIIGGYFYAADLYSRSDSNPTSDEMEVVYALAPDPSGTYGTRISKDFYMDELIPAILPHELQHAINFNQHVFVNHEGPEASWLNEGASHLVEDLVGHGNSNPGRYAIYFASPSSTPLVSDSSPGLAQRGAAYLFLRYLYERADDGDAFLKRLVSSELSGIENVEAAFQGEDESFDEFEEFMIRWTAAMALSSKNLGTGSRFAYQSRTVDSSTGKWKGAVFTGDADDGRGTTLSGVNTSEYSGYSNSNIAQTGAKFFTIEDIPEQIGLQATGSSNFAVLIRTE